MSDAGVPLPFLGLPQHIHGRSRARFLRGLGQPGQPATGPMTLAPYGADDQQHKTRPDLPPWIYQPVNWENLDKINYVTLPAIGSSSNIISFTVPPGRNGIINKVACNFVGGGWVEGSGDVVWRILIDGTPPPGATDYDNILASLGGPSQPTGIAGFRIFENQVVTFVVVNSASGANGGVVLAGQRAGARLTGWTYPRDIEEPDLWI